MSFSLQHFKDMSFSQVAVYIYIAFLRMLHFYNIHFFNTHLIVSNDTILLCNEFILVHIVITTVCSFISILYTICNISFRFDVSDIRNYLIKA